MPEVSSSRGSLRRAGSFPFLCAAEANVSSDLPKDTRPKRVARVLSHMFWAFRVLLSHLRGKGQALGSPPGQVGGSLGTQPRRAKGTCHLRLVPAGVEGSPSPEPRGPGVHSGHRHSHRGSSAAEDGAPRSRRPSHPPPLGSLTAIPGSQKSGTSGCSPLPHQEQGARSNSPACSPAPGPATSLG